MLFVLCSALAGACAPTIEPPAPFEVEDLDEQDSRSKKSKGRGEPGRESGRSDPDREPRPETPPASNRPTTWTGALPATPVVTFGGSGYCTYAVQFTDVEVSITRDANGVITSSTVEGTFKETTVSECGQSVIPTHVHTYSFGGGQPSTGGGISLTPASTNEPRAKLILTPSSDGGNPRAQLEWKRIDIGAPLDWSLNAEVALTGPNQ